MGSTTGARETPGVFVRDAKGNTDKFAGHEFSLNWVHVLSGNVVVEVYRTIMEGGRPGGEDRKIIASYLNPLSWGGPIFEQN